MLMNNHSCISNFAGRWEGSVHDKIVNVHPLSGTWNLLLQLIPYREKKTWKTNWRCLVVLCLCACVCVCARVCVCPRSCCALLCVYLMFSNGLLSEKPPLLYDNLSTRFYSCPTLGFCCFSALVCPLLTKTTVLLFFSTFESPLSSLDSGTNEYGRERKRGLCSQATCNNLPLWKKRGGKKAYE